MQRRASSFNTYTIEAPDGNVGSISDVLFDGNSWKLRWFVINTGSWLFGRKLLIHPAALGEQDTRQRAFSVAMTKAEVEASPDIGSDPPVFMQMQQDRAAYYTYSPMWGVDDYRSGGLGLSHGLLSGLDGRQRQYTADVGDPHLRSLGEVIGYHIHALDGDIGHLEDFLVDDETWKVEYAIVDTKNWGFGNHVLIAPSDIQSIDWSQRYICLELTRYKIKSAASWQEPDVSDQERPEAAPERIE